MKYPPSTQDKMKHSTEKSLSLRFHLKVCSLNEIRQIYLVVHAQNVLHIMIVSRNVHINA